jgi:hypothetical protein
MTGIRIAVIAVALGVAGAAWAKLPAPSPEAAAKAAETKQKADDAAKKDAADLAKAQDRTVANYKRNKGAGGQKPAKQ